jgi:hypothetical protein
MERERERERERVFRILMIFPLYFRGFLDFLLEAYSLYPLLFFSLLFHFYFFLSSLSSVYERYKCLKSGLTLTEMQNPFKCQYLNAG